VFIKTLKLILGCLLGVLASVTSYLTFLTLLAVPSWKPRNPKEANQPFFYVLIPAHNEEVVIARTVKSLQALEYPKELFEICVVADNCTDQTAQIARDLGVHVFERFNTTERGKGYALQWLLDQLLPASPANSAYLFVDADSTISPNFLHIAARELGNGAEVIQAYYGGANPDESWRSALRYIALTAMNYSRLLGRQRLGLSAGLRGNGMVFSANIARSFGWQAYTRTDDAELHARLLLLGQRVTFAPDCQVWGLMPVTEKQARSQDVGWEGGRVDIARQYVPSLIKALPGRPLQQQMALLDGAIELATPPLSMLVGLGGLGLGISWLLKSKLGRNLAQLILLEIGVYISASLAAARVPWRVSITLLYAPFFIIWKIALYVYALFTSKRHRRWIRTSRVAEEAGA
jgi:cellulose synthase/poly-beta-1,6-N-acetylglucosamine synthase-like glycosyltransferase